MVASIDKKLLRALSARQWERALVLLENGANPTARTAKGSNGLMLLADGSSVEVDQPILQTLADLCLEKGCLLSDTDRRGNTVMHLCSMNTGLFTHCLRYKPDCGVLNNSQQNVLHCLADNPHVNLNLVKRCGALGADIHQKDKHGNSLFHYFCRRRFHGAHLLMHFVANGLKPTLEQIGEGCWNALRNTTPDKAMVAYLKYAYQQGVDFNSIQCEDLTLLIRAVLWGRTKAVRYLLNHGVHIEHSESGQPLGMALNTFEHNNMLPLLDLLVEHGLDINSSGQHNCQQTMVHQLMFYLALDCFKEHHAVDILKRLEVVLQYGGDLNQPDADGVSPVVLGLSQLIRVYPCLSQEKPHVQAYVHAVLNLFVEYGGHPVEPPGQTVAMASLLPVCELRDLFEAKIARRQHNRLLSELSKRDGADAPRLKM